MWDQKGSEVVPGYGCLIFQAEELTLMVDHSFIQSNIKFLLPLGTVGLGTQEVSGDLVHLRCLSGICGVGDSRHSQEAGGYTSQRGNGEEPGVARPWKPKGELSFKEEESLGQALCRSVE